MATMPTPSRECEFCTHEDGTCNGDVVLMTTSCTREVFVRCAPVCVSGSPHDQAKRFYDCLPGLLNAHGAQMKDVVLERVFFRDIQADIGTFSAARQKAYELSGVTGDQLPVTSCVEQPPCRPDQAFELQVQAMASNGGQEIRVRSFPATEYGATAKLLEIAGHRHLYLGCVNGCNSDGTSRGFRRQSDSMFQRTTQLLRDHGTDFSKVLRTWCYLDNIDRDYAEFNISRNEFFQQHVIQRLPASTGIRSGLHPNNAQCAIDLYALLDPDGVQIEVMHTPTLNEAAEYGASFSRGMKLVLPEKTVLFISGTASVDEQGATVHVDDIQKQIERMLLNVRELLAPHEADFSDVVQVITYLKSRDNLDLFLQIWDDWGLRGLPNSVVEAGVCRPDLLCELEAIAILPGR